MGVLGYAALRRTRLARSLAGALAALVLFGPSPSRGNGAEAPEAGAEAAKARAASRECLAHTPTASRFQCDLVLSPELARLSVLYGADGWSGGRAFSWQDLTAVPLFPRIERGFGKAETGLMEWRDWQDAESRMRLEGKSNGLRYKAEYGFFQDGFYKKGIARRPAAFTSVHSGGRFDAAWKLGFLEPKLELSRSWRVNQEQKPGPDGGVDDGDELARSKARFALSFPVPNLPLLTLSAGRETRSLTPTEHQLAAPDENEVLSDVVSASLWHGGERWQASVTSSYFEIAKDQRRKASEAVVQDHIVTFAYRPTDTLSVQPLVEYMKMSYPGADYGSTSTLASLGLYRSSLDGRLRSYVYVSYYANRDSGGWVDTRSTDLAVGLERDVSRFLGLPHGRQSIGLQVSGGYYDDLVYRDASIFTYGAFVLIRIQP